MEWVYLLAMAQEGGSVGCDFCSGETLVWMFCGLGNTVKNYVVISCSCTKGSVRRVKWRLLGKVVQPLQSVNYYDSRAHGHERHGPFTRLVGILVGMVWVGSSRSGLWYEVGVKPVCMFLLQVRCL
jgi:hypothetical protein